MSEGADYAADSDLENANEQRDGKLTKSLYSKICLKRPLKNRQNEDINDNW